MKTAIKNQIKKVIATYHYGVAHIFSKKLPEENKADLMQYFKNMGYQELPYPLPTPALKENTKDLSFIIPVYNCAQFIGYCLDTIMEQKTKYSFEVICVNDGSKDNTLEILQEYKKKYPTEIIIVDQPNGGISKARNTGIDHAQGEYLAFIDCDDFVFENYIDRLMNTAKQNNADIVQAGYCRVLPNHKIIESFPRKAMSFSMSEQEKALLNVSGFMWSSVIRKSLFDHVRLAIGYWYEDMITCSIIMNRAKKISIIADCLYGYTSNPNSVSNSIWDSHKIKCLDQFILAEKFHECCLNDLNIQDDALNFSVLLREVGKLTCGRFHYQPEEVKRKAFQYIVHIVKCYPKEIKPLTKNLEKIHQAILANDYFKWKHLSLYMSWANVL